MRAIIAALPVLLLAAPALALPEGRFEALVEGGSGTVTVEGDRFAIDVGAPGCGGGAEGTWEETGPGAFLVTVPPLEAGFPACTIAVTEAGGAYEMLESDCLPFHGAACGFSGSFDPAVPAAE